MYSLVFVVLAASGGLLPEHGCAVERLKPFVSPTGTSQAWPRAAALPSHLANELGTLISDEGNYKDGFSHWLIVDRVAQASFVIQRGGFGGNQVVFGPLPLASCAKVPPNNSFKPTPLRGAA